MLGSFLATVVSVASLAAPTSAEAYTKQDTTVTMSDGTPIAVTYYQPDGPAPAGGFPAVMMFHGLGQTRNSLDLNTWSANRVAETYLVPRGYAVLTFDARAHGESGGLFSLDGPRELADTQELFRWLVDRHPVDAQHVGAFGVSYGGGMVWLATVSGVPFAAVAVAATWTDLRQALMPQGLVRAGFVAEFGVSVPQSRWDPALTALLRTATSEEDTPELRDFLASRSTRTRLANVTTPVFMLQGRRDFAFDADQAIAAYRLLRGPKRLYIGDLGHPPAANPENEVGHFAVEIAAWFDHFLRGVNNGIDAINGTVELARDPWGGTGTTVANPGLPPTRTLRYTSRATSRLTATGKVVRTFARVPHLETFGAPSVRVTMSSRTGYRHLVAVLTALTPAGSEIVVTDGGIELPASRGRRTVTIRLANEITPIPARSRLRVTIAATSTVQSLKNLVYLLPVPAGSTASIGRVTLTLPVLKQPISP